MRVSREQIVKGREASLPSRAQPGDSDVVVAAKGMCRGAAQRCHCDEGAACFADDQYGTEALQAVTALRAAHRLLTPPREG